MTCKNGHDGPRRKSGNCIACEKERAKRAWAENRDELAAANKRRYAENRDARRAKDRAIRNADIEAHRAKARAWYAANAEHARAYVAARRAANPAPHKASLAASYIKHRERRLEYARNRLKNEPEAIKANQHNRRAREMAATGKHTAADIREIAAAQKHKCAYCRVSIRKGWHLDHIMPLKLGGTNDRSNLQLLCAPCNHHKSAKHPVTFAQQIGLLL